MKLGKAAKKILGILAPTVGTVIGGPLGGVAGKMLADTLGVKEEQLNEIIAKNDPETAAKLASLENDFEIRMAELGFDIEELHRKDRESARQLAIETGMYPQIVLSVIFVTGYFAVVIGLLAGAFSIPSESSNLLSALIGVLTAGVIKVLDFFLGSSAGSKRKTEKLHG